MGWIDDLIKNTEEIIDEMESDSDKSRSQSFLETFWANRTSLEEARDSSHGEEKIILSKLLATFNRKGKENDMEPY